MPVTNPTSGQLCLHRPIKNTTSLTSAVQRWTQFDKIKDPAGWKMATAAAAHDEREQVALLTRGHMKTSLKAMLEHLRHSTDPILQLHAQKLLACRGDKPCHARGCPRCALIKRDRKNQIQKETKYSLSKDPQARSGQRASIFHLFPENEVWVISINLEPVRPGDAAERIAYWRPRLHSFFDELEEEFGSCAVQGRFEDDAFLARDMHHEEFAEHGSLLSDSLNTALMKIHLHCLVHIPENSPEPIKKRLVESFGPGRVTDLRSIRHTLDEDDIDLHGIEGFARYMSKEFVDLSNLQGANLSQINAVLKSMFSRTRNQNRFDHGLSGVSNPEGRRLARWIKRCRRDYDIPSNWSLVDIEDFLVEWDVCELVHNHPESADALDDMRLDYESYRDSSVGGLKKCPPPSYKLYARKLADFVGKIVALGQSCGRVFLVRLFALRMPSISLSTGPPI